MTPYLKRQTPSTRRMAEDMLVRNFAARTIDAYTYHVDRFARHFGKLPEDLGLEEIRKFQLGQDEVHDLIQCVTQPKHRAVLLTLYAAELRLGEATHLKIPDIDSDRMQLKINAGKGRKDRYVPISPRLLEELRAYWKIERPSNYLFPGKCGMDAAAMMVLHTWNQRLEHHPHSHALVPGSGPSLDGQSWVPCRRTQRTHGKSAKPFLVDNRKLGRSFRDHFIAGVRALIQAGKLKLQDAGVVNSLLDELSERDWVVFI